MLYIFLVAILNIAIGFALAVHLQRRYQIVAMADENWEFDEMPGSLSDDPPAETSAEISTAESIAELQERDLPEQPDNETATDDTPAADDMPLEKSESHTLVEELLAEVNGFHDQLAEVDEQLRVCLEAPDSLEIEQVLNSLNEATNDYRQKREAAHERFAGAHKDRPEFEAVCEEMRTSAANQDESIESATSAITSFDYQGDLEDGCRTMVDETGGLLQSNSRLRGTADLAMLEVMRAEGRLGSMDKEQRRDSLTGASSRAGLEADLLEWWDGDPQHLKQLSLVMIDIDGLNKLHAEHGQRAGDAVLCGVAQLLRVEVGDKGSLARFSDRRFVFMFPDTDVRSATSTAERVRQRLEKVRFVHKERRIRVTVSCSVAEAASEDTTATLLGRVEATLHEAKRHGRNRTFLHEGEYSTPVVPPNFDLEEKEIVI